MMTVSRRRALAVIAGGAGLAALPGSAFASDPIPGIDVSLGQVPPGLTVTGRTGRNGDVVLRPRAAGTYEVYLPNPEQITLVSVLVIQQPGIEVVTSDPFGPAPRNRSKRGYVAAKGGGALAFIVQPPPRGQPFAAITIRAQTYDPPPVVPPRA